MSDLRKLGHQDRFAFRKRCGWCGVQLRRWQRDLCRNCKAHVNTPYASAPCVQGARWNEAPDEWRSRGR